MLVHGDTPRNDQRHAFETMQDASNSLQTKPKESGTALRPQESQPSCCAGLHLQHQHLPLQVHVLHVVVLAGYACNNSMVHIAARKHDENDLRPHRFLIKVTAYMTGGACFSKSAFVLASEHHLH